MDDHIYSHEAACKAIHALAKQLKNGNITSKEAVTQCSAAMVDGVLSASVNMSEVADDDIIARHDVGVAGAGTGKVAKSVEEAQTYIDSGEPYILVLPETNSKMVPYIGSAAGLITHNGGPTSHGAIITRQKNKPALIGLKDIDVNSGDEITIDGGRGLVIKGAANIIQPNPKNEDLQTILDAADALESSKAHHMTVKANVDSKEDALVARVLGAKGVGVNRTEHMFLRAETLPIMQGVLLASEEEERKSYLNRLEPLQKEDFKGILEAMDGLPVTVRLLDAPMHEFMPKDADDIDVLAEALGKSDTQVIQNIEDASENNPMLGNRGVRLAEQHPEIYEMQIRALLTASAELEQEGKDPKTQIMIPMVSVAGEVISIKAMAERIAEEVEAKTGRKPAYELGAMTELPASFEMAGELAKQCDFFSVGSNDLTQTVLGLSRDDTNETVALYQQKGHFSANPNVTLHPAVVKVMERGIGEGKAANSDLEVSVCGEHGGDPESIHACQRIGVDAVSVSNPRIAVARLVTAQAMLQQELEQSSWVEREGRRPPSQVDIEL